VPVEKLGRTEIREFLDSLRGFNTLNEGQPVFRASILRRATLAPSSYLLRWLTPLALQPPVAATGAGSDRSGLSSSVRQLRRWGAQMRGVRFNSCSWFHRQDKIDSLGKTQQKERSSSRATWPPS